MTATVTASRTQRAPPVDRRAGPSSTCGFPDRLAGVPIWVVVGGGGAAGHGDLGVPALALSERPVLDGRGAVSGDLLAFADPRSPHVLRHDGSPPLYYLLLHVWMSVFGSSESRHPHAVAGLRAAVHPGRRRGWRWNLFGRWAGRDRAGAVRAQPVPHRLQPGNADVLADGAARAAGHGRLHQRLHLPPAALPDPVRDLPDADALHARLGSVLRRRRGDRVPGRVARERRAARSCCATRLLAFGGAAVLFLPWLPTLLYQATHTGSPWDSAPNFGAPVQISRNLMGGDRATVALVLASALGLATMFTRKWRTRESLTLWTLLILPVGTLGLRLDRLAHLAGVGVPLLRPDPRRAAAAGRAGDVAGQGQWA